MKEENLSTLMFKIIFKDIIPKISQELRELNLEEHIFGGGEYFGSSIRKFKILSDGRAFVSYNDKWVEYANVNNFITEEDCQVFIKSNTIANIKSFMLKSAYELNALKMMKKEIISSLSKVRGEINIDKVFRNLMIEK